MMSFVSYLLFLGTKLSHLWCAALVKCICSGAKISRLQCWFSFLICDIGLFNFKYKLEM